MTTTTTTITSNMTTTTTVVKAAKVAMEETTTQKKMTKAMWFDVLTNIVAASDYSKKSDLLDFITNEKALLEKKSSKSKDTKRKKTNDIIKDTIVEVLEELKGGKVTITELLGDSRLESYAEIGAEGTTPKIVTMTSQKLASLMTQLVKDGVVTRVLEKKKQAFFYIPYVEETETENADNGIEIEGDGDLIEDYTEETEVEE